MLRSFHTDWLKDTHPAETATTIGLSDSLVSEDYNGDRDVHPAR
jgi:hypothetical protein